MKYVGSKQRIAKEITPYIQDAISLTGFSLYLEPFVGGGNVIDKVDAGYKIGADSHRYLVSLLRAAGGGTAFPPTISRGEYEAVRDNKGAFPEWYVGLVGFCASYNAKFFGGYANGVRTKDGAVRNYTDEAIRNLERQRDGLKNIPFICCDYQEWQNTSHAVIYCDPPYKGTTNYSTGHFDTEAFFGWCFEMAKTNVLIISEYEAPPEFTEIASFGVTATLDKSQKLKRKEKLFTAGIGCEVFNNQSRKEIST